MGDGFLRLSLAAQKHRQVVVRTGVARLALEDLLQLGPGFAVPAEVHQNRRQSESRLDVLRVDLHRLFVERHGPLGVCLPEKRDGDRIAVALNGRPLEAAPQEPGWLAADVPPEVMRRGENELAVALEAGESSALALALVELDVRYR